jgi:hypothetical protein
MAFFGLIAFMMYSNVVCTDLKKVVTEREAEYTAYMLQNVEEGEDITEYEKNLKMPKKTIQEVLCMN